jgi:hypothetical protein
MRGPCKHKDIPLCAKQSMLMPEEISYLYLNPEDQGWYSNCGPCNPDVPQAICKAYLLYDEHKFILILVELG